MACVKKTTGTPEFSFLQQSTPSNEIKKEREDKADNDGSGDWKVEGDVILPEVEVAGKSSDKGYLWDEANDYSRDYEDDPGDNKSPW